MKNFVFAIVLLSLFSCGEKSAETPGDILEKEKLVDVQVDLYMVEAAHNMNILKQDTLDTEYKNLFEAVMKKHNITKDDYESSLRYYTLDNESLNEIYDSVNVRLKNLEDKITYTKEK